MLTHVYRMKVLYTQNLFIPVPPQPSHSASLAMPRVSEKRRLIQWYQKSIDAYMEQKTIEILQEALEDVEDSDMDWLDDCSVTSQCLSTTFAWTSSSSAWSTTDSLSSSDDSMKSKETTIIEMEDICTYYASTEYAIS